MSVCRTYLTWAITLHVVQILNTEQMQHYTPQKHGLLQERNCKYTA